MRLQSSRPPKRPKGPIFLLLFVALIVGAIFYFSTSAEEVPVETIEVAVPGNGE